MLSSDRFQALNASYVVQMASIIEKGGLGGESNIHDVHMIPNSVNQSLLLI